MPGVSGASDARANRSASLPRAAPAPMTTLGKRIVTALILAALVLATLFALPPKAAPTLFSLFLLVGLWEWSGFLRAGPAVRVIYVLAGIGLAAAVFTQADATAVERILQLTLLWWVAVAVWLYSRDIRYGAVTIVVAGYACLLGAWLALLVILSAVPAAWLFVWLATIIAAADIGAYFSGKRFGRHRLAPQLSPGKTLEGLAGGLLAASAVAVSGGFLLGLNLLSCALLGPALALVSVLGDLTVSAFKRNAGLKDTGWVLPGHGGVMDRIDSLVAAAPFFAVFLSFLRF